MEGPLINCIEGNDIAFNITVTNELAPVHWIVHEMVLDHHASRIEKIDLGNGSHQLIIKDCQLADAGIIVATTPTGIGNTYISPHTIESNFTLNVLEAEKVPTIGDVHTITCLVKSSCKIIIPYWVNGTKQSDVELEAMRNADILHLATYFNVTKVEATTTRLSEFQLVIRHASVEKSGEFKFVLMNSKGRSGAKSIKVTIMDDPSPPLNVRVNNISYDSVVVKWDNPIKNGGSNMTKFIIEVCY